MSDPSRAYWSTERRTSLTERRTSLTSTADALAKQQYPTSPSDGSVSPSTDSISLYDDSSSDDNGPGAFAVKRVRVEDEETEEDEWDPTEPQEVDREAAFNDHSIAAAVSSHFNETVATEGQTKKKRQCLFLFLAVLALIFCGIVGTVVVVLLSGNKETAERSESPGKKTCENTNDPYVQCEVCSQPIQVSDAVQDAYDSLKAFEGLAEYLDIDMQIESCAPENMALVWLASEYEEGVAQGNIFSFYEPVPSRFLLAFLYFAWDGKHWIENENWLSSNSECDWHGVGCNEHGKIESLSLPFNNIKGSLESRLGLLRDIKKLDLGSNKINGSIPHQLWNLPLLEELSLGNNRISGTLPASLGGNTTSLAALALFQNQLVGSLPSLSGLTNLKNISLAFNMFDGRIPSDWGDLRQLERLDVSYMLELSGTIPSSFGLLTGLKTLIVDYTGLSVSDFLGKTMSLETFQASYTPFYGSIPTTIGLMTNLVNLQIQAVGLAGSIPSELGKCTMLGSFLAARNSITGTLPIELSNLQNLVHLDVARNVKLKGTVPQEYTKLESLKKFEIFGTSITGTIPSEMCNKSGDKGQLPIFADIQCSCCTAKHHL